MGVYSDVVICVKEELFKELPNRSKKFLASLAESSAALEEGRLFAATHIKWYWHDYDDIRSLYADLGEFDEEDYLVLVACHDYPSSDEGNVGGWHENPWSPYRDWKVSIEWTQVGVRWLGGE